MNHKQLVDQLNSLQAEMANYKAEVSSLRSKVEAYENVETEIAAVQPAASAGPTSRRRMLKRFAAGVAGMGALGVIGSTNTVQTVLAATAADNAIEATGGSDGYGLNVSGGLASIFVSATTPGAGDHQVGELYRDSSGTLFYCVGAGTGTAAKWRHISDTTTAGAFHLLANPVRVVDTRNAGGPFTFVAGSGVARQYDISALSSGQVPSGATGVAGNLTVTSVGVGGFGSVYPASFSGTSNINFSAGTDLANSFTSGLAANKLFIHMFLNSAGNVHVLMDIAGYYI